MFCQNCGTKLREEARFCHVCGTKQTLEAHDEAAPAQETAPEAPLPAEPEPVMQEESGPEAPAPAEEAAAPQPLTAAFSWENVKISGEIKNGVGTITLTFQ